MPFSDNASAQVVSTAPNLPDALSDPPAGILVIFSPATFAWIADALKTIYRAQKAQLDRQDAVIAALGPLTQSLEGMLVAMNDLNAAQDRSEASTTAALDGITREIQQVKDAVAALGSAPSAAEIAAFKARVNANTDRLDAAVAALAGDDPTA